jgi:hypothetical protein
METRTLRLTVNGAPAVMPVTGFYRATGVTYIKFEGGHLVVDNTPEELAALWDAAAPVVERGPDGWQTVVHDHRDSPRLSAPYGYTTAGPWEPVGVAPGARGECDILWRRPLHWVAE